MPLPRYARRPLRQQGAGTARKRPERQLVYRAVALRAKGRCEIPGCGARQDPLDPHHSMGRGGLPGVPAVFCDTAELVLGICRSCHDAIHRGDVKLGEQARWLAMERFAQRWDLPHPGDVADDMDPEPARLNEFHVDAVDVMRELVRRLEERTGA